MRRRRDRFFGGPAVDQSRYAAVERQKVGEEYRYVRLHDEPMAMSECLPWLIEQGFVRRVEVPVDPEDEHNDGYRLVGWGSTYFMVPWEKSVPR